MKKLIFTYALLLCCFAQAKAQTITVLADGFNAPIGLTLDEAGNIWLAETGSGANDGKVDMITPSGTVYTVVEGLPSHFDVATFETTGAWHVYHLPGNKMAVIVGSGPDENAGSLITFDLADYTPGDDPLTVADAEDIMHISTYALASGYAESDPYTAAWDDAGNIYIADAAANAIFKSDAVSGTLSTLTTFPAIPNTFTPFPPFIDYVPTALINVPGGGFFLCNLTGFPFLPGIAQVLRVESDGSKENYAAGLSQAVDMEFDAATGDLYVLQFGVYDTAFTPIFSSAMITKIAAGGDTTVFAAGFGPSAGFVLDGAGGAYVTSLFTGEVLHITFPVGIEQTTDTHAFVSVSPNPFNSNTSIQYTVAAATDVRLQICNAAGTPVYTQYNSDIAAGTYSFQWNGCGENTTAIAAGIYFLVVTADTEQQIITIIKN